MKSLPGCIWLLTGLLVFSGCTGFRYLEDGQKLYTGHKIHIEKAGEGKVSSDVEVQLDRVVRPEPNQQLIVSRPRLWLYFAAGDPTGRGVRHLMKNRFGRPPVLYETVDITRNLRLIENRLFNMGYFDASVSYEEKITGKTAVVHYHAALQPPYVFGDLSDLLNDHAVGLPINALLRQTQIVSGKPYSLDLLKAERIRIDRALKNEGYFFFHPDHILFRLDTVSRPRTVGIYPSLKTDVAAEAFEKQTIGQIHIVADYLSGADTSLLVAGGWQHVDSLHIRDSHGLFKPGLFRSSVFFNPGDIYRADAHDQTISHLAGLGIFQFVNLRFIPREEENVLDVRIMLSPAPKRSMSAELLGVSKSNNFAGPGLTASLANINVFGGAEKLHLGVNASYESLLGRRSAPASSVEVGVESGLSFPRFVLWPKRLLPRSNQFVPSTDVSLAANFISRSDAFDLTSLRLQYRYAWNESKTVRHVYSPLVLNLFVLGEVSDNLNRLFTRGDLARRGLFEQFVMGGEYSWFYNSQLRDVRISGNHTYLNINLDLSGNLAYLASRAVGKNATADGEYRFFNQGFSQYARADADYRYYVRLGADQRLIARLVAGVGLPYGNSTTMPYMKLFTTGGSNSIRAFHPRSVGPGSYAPPDSLQGRFNIHQSGDIKLEMNLEYRFGITSLLKGAVFVDAGNVWRLQDYEQTPGGTFSWSGFPEQIALGTGAGIRIDVSLFILRLDLAFPLAVPYDGSRAYLSPPRPLDRSWRRDSLVFNLAIGYPF